MEETRKREAAKVNNALSLPKLLGKTLRNLFKKPSTVMVPPREIKPAEGYRGIHRVNYDKCISCSLCAIECPALAIKMVTIPETKKRYPEIDYGKCIFCYRCVEVCPVNAYEVSIEKPAPETKPVIIKETPLEWYKSKKTQQTSSTQQSPQK